MKNLIAVHDDDAPLDRRDLLQNIEVLLRHVEKMVRSLQ